MDRILVSIFSFYFRQVIRLSVIKSRAQSDAIERLYPRSFVDREDLVRFLKGNHG